MTYYSELTRAMDLLGAAERTIFIGQTVAYPGTGITGTLKGVPPEKLLELPVAEDMHMGMATGLALAGHTAVSIYPRWNFLLLAANQLVNHLDRLPIYSHGGYKPRVIVRVAVPSVVPLDPQSQHDGDFTQEFFSMCKTVQFFNLRQTSEIFPAYEYALHHEGATLLVEHVELYDKT